MLQPLPFRIASPQVTATATPPVQLSDGPPMRLPDTAEKPSPEELNALDCSRVQDSTSSTEVGFVALRDVS